VIGLFLSFPYRRGLWPYRVKVLETCLVEVSKAVLSLEKHSVSFGLCFCGSMNICNSLIARYCSFIYDSPVSCLDAVCKRSEVGECLEQEIVDIANSGQHKNCPVVCVFFFKKGKTNWTLYLDT
jgi:hypothetical protein